MRSSSHILDRLGVTFDDHHAVADTGLLLPATLLEHLDAEAIADAAVTRGYRPGRKIVTVVAGLLAGADCIDDLAILRAGATERILPTQVLAPSTISTWLRSLTFGHIRQLDRLTELLLARAWAVGAGIRSPNATIRKPTAPDAAKRADDPATWTAPSTGAATSWNAASTSSSSGAASPPATPRPRPTTAAPSNSPPYSKWLK